MTAPFRLPLLRRATLVAGLALSIGAANAATPYDTWVKLHGLKGATADPRANPDGDRLPNILEYTFGTDPLAPEKNYAVAPALEPQGDRLRFVYRVNGESDGVAKLRVLKSSDTKNWSVAPGRVERIGTDGGQVIYALPVPSDAKDAFYRLEVSVPYGAVTLDEAGIEHAEAGATATITVGTNVGTYWEGAGQPGGMPAISEVVIRQEPPKTAWKSATDQTLVANTSKYPGLAGGSQGAFTDYLIADFPANEGKQPPLRSWMGWFLWGNGTPPPGVNPGIFMDIQNYPTSTGYGKYNGTGWDYFNYQWKQTGVDSTAGRDAGVWNAIRVDQQPLYLTPLTVAYNWAPGLFGYVSKPFATFPNNAFYWKDKSIVRGLNISGSIPFFYQYGNKVGGAIPAAWQQAWMYTATRPLENTVVVPSNLTPDELLQAGPWNKEEGIANDPFPYPVWDTSSAASVQTPYAVQVDKIGDWHADLIWEAARKSAGGVQTPYYNAHRYKRSAFNQPGSGNYMKATVAQGSPFVWCETNNNRYAIFYNLIRTNLKDQINNNTGTGAGMVPGGPWDVPGVSGVKFVLLYGDQVNPNQWFQEVEPWYADLGGGDNDTQLPGGFNPPPGTWDFKNGSGPVTVPGQHNYTYTAIFYRDASLARSNGTKSGTDAQNNPYFYLKFNNPGKNWFVVGSVPEMRYYNVAQIKPDPEPILVQAALDWAREMGKYAFNFPTGTKIDYAVTNMYETTTDFEVELENPFAASDANGGAATSVPHKTVMALSPHQYQPLTLGPDYSKVGAPEVVWNPLRKYGQDFPMPASAPSNANRNLLANGSLTPSRWGYWSLHGNLKTIIGNSFTTAYPFQNFLPVMPPPNFEDTMDQTGVGAVSISLPPGAPSYEQIVAPPTVSISQDPAPGPPDPALVTFSVVLKPDQTIDSITPIDPNQTWGFVDGTPPPGWKLVISGGGGSNGAAHMNTQGGKIANVTIDNPGENYTSVPTVTLEQNPGVGATFQAVVDQFTGQVQQVNVLNPGGGYPDGVPPSSVHITIAAPITHPQGTQATAYAQVSGGKVLAIFMLENGSGYSTILRISQKKNGVDFYGEPPAVVIPTFDTNNPPKVSVGAAQIIQAGSGFDLSQPFDVTVVSNIDESTVPVNQRAQVTVAKPGTILAIATSDQIAGPGGFSVPGFYPSTGGAPTDVTVSIPPPSSSSAAQTATATWLPTADPSTVSFALVDRGSGYTADDLPYINVGGTDYLLQNTLDGGAVSSLSTKGGVTYPTLTAPAAVIFKKEGGGPATGSGAVAMVYPCFGMGGTAQVGTPTVGGYVGDQQVGFIGGELYPAGVTKPDITLTIPPDPGNPTDPVILEDTDFVVNNGGAGFHYEISEMRVVGGQGFDALLAPVVQGGVFKAVKVVRQGSHYPAGVTAFCLDGAGNSHTGPSLATFNVTVTDGKITAVEVTNGGSGYPPQPNVTLLKPKPWSNASNPEANPDPVIADNPKGTPPQFKLEVSGGAVTKVTKVPLVPELTEAKYLPGMAGVPTPDSLAATFWWRSAAPFAAPVVLSKGYLAAAASAKTQVGQVIYSSAIAQYQTTASLSTAPFGTSFIGKSTPNADAAAPDGYGLGGQMAASSKFIGDLFTLQQHYAGTDQNNVARAEPVPSKYAVNAGTTLPNTFEFDILQTNSPYVSLSLGLKSSVQAMQRAVTDLFLKDPAHNSPLVTSPNIWSADYFAIYEGGRITINPTQTQPVWGVLSSVQSPGYIPTTNPPPTPPINTDHENDYKTGLSKWQPGMLWSGFGVSDQWNDQHYFYGYYLSSAALAGIFDYSWDLTLASKPPSVWADANQMGTAIDQILMTLANDPDNAALQSALYKKSEFTYQKFAFFDQWSGHPWATGAQPGTTGSALLPTSPVAGVGADPYGFWKSYGTDSDKYNGENENSIFEGLQAWSATILWGAATDRKSVVDLGIYLYSAGLASADLYFLDKNYNLANTANNKFSWVPVTTAPSTVLKPTKNGGNNWPANTDYVSGNPLAFYTAPEALGGAASAGQSLLKKVENTNNNYFYGYPTGTKFIQAYPPTPWTLGMSRNTLYMRKWAGAMMREEWTAARNSSLYQAADWNAMGLTSALSGVPYNPGDQPYPLTGGNIDTPAGQTLLEQTWSSWVTRDQRPGAKVSLNPPFLTTTVLDFLLSLDNHGVPDWTYLGKVMQADGTTADNTGIVFTAVFTKRPKGGDTAVTGSFVAFNPGWTTRHVTFNRLNSDGTTGAQVTQIGNVPGKPGLIAIPPKRMVTLPYSFNIQ
jgi:Glycosyl hydrolase family 81 C-terminal domain